MQWLLELAGVYLRNTNIGYMNTFENRFQTFRIKEIEACLRSRAWTKEALLEEMNERIIQEFGPEKQVQERTFNEDLKKIKNRLEEEGETIKKTRIGTQVYYEYSNKEISCFDEALSKADVQKITKALAVIDQVKGIAFNRTLTDVIGKLNTQVRSRENKEKPVISFQTDAVADGFEHISELYDAIIGKHVISFPYKPFHEQQSEKNVHPYYLKQYNNRWFLFGYVLKNKRVEVFALDRIAGNIKKMIKEPYLEPEGFFDPEEYFSDIIGVTRYPSVPKQEIIINISAVSAAYVQTKKWHSSQEVVHSNKDGSIRIRLLLIPNRELKQLILSMGAAAKVISPASLVKEMKEEAEALAAAYKTKK